MKNALILILILGLTCTGCLFANVTIPYDTDLDQTKLNPNLKQGEASSYSAGWLVAWGDAGTKAAADNGGIATVYHMDRKIFQVLFGLYSKHTTVVYGE